MNLSNFIAKFEKIPENLWAIGSLCKEDGTKCALGHAGFDCDLLVELFHGVQVTIIKKTSCNLYSIGETLSASYDLIAAINNGETKEYQQSTPKQRMLAALYDLDYPSRVIKSVFDRQIIFN